MQSFLVETKQEYTTQLINVITPLIYEGLQSIYNEVQSISNNDSVLKSFQTAVQRIPKWNNDMINNETNRILNNTKSYTWLSDLIKATLKANIVVLTYNPTVTQQTSVDPSLYQNIQITDFIHKIYIECARELWNNPYLFYHNYPPIELKRNQRDTILLIKDCIREAIRKLLPVKHILQIYLGEEMVTGNNDTQFDKSISEIEEKNLNKLIKKDLYNNNSIKHNYPQLDYVDSITKKLDTGKPIMSDNTDVTVGSKILDIIENKNIKLSDNNTSSDFNNNMNLLNNTDNNESQRMNNILKGLEDNSETSITNNNTKNNFQEVFSNSLTKSDVNINQNNKNNKAKFFANYLQI
jgi:hypothetical protein